MPVLRFEYKFDAEVLDADLRAELAGGPRTDAAVGTFMSEVRGRIEAALADTPGLRVGNLGLSELWCPGASEIPEPQ